MLELVDVTYCFDDTPAIDHITLTLAHQERLAILGPSGCGKSTLLKTIAGLFIPTRGHLYYAGNEITYQPAETRYFALMFQDFALFPHLSVQHNVMFGLIERGMPKKQAQQRVHAILNDFGLTRYSNATIWQLSGGEQQRVALARALVTHPRLMLLDEPFSNLDPILSETLRTECMTRIAALECGMILVTHNRHEAFTLADRVAIMQNGRIVQIGTPKQLLAAPASPWLARFIGYRNVTEHGVIPETAIQLGHPYPAATITNIEYHVEGFQLHLQSPWGPLVVTLSPREWAQIGAPLMPGGQLGVGVDETMMIRF